MSNSKAWQRSQRLMKRRAPTRLLRDRILIVCEGKETEPNYFRAFPVSLDVHVYGAGANTLSLVQEAIRMRASKEKEGYCYNEVWCVFDRDSFPAHNFNQAFEAAANEHIRIAYSNPCFELWFFLHYHFIDAALRRGEYSTKLSNFMKRTYRKNDKQMYNDLKEKQLAAIRNAKRLESGYLPRLNPEKDNPSTTVYKLVERLNEFVDGGHE